MKLNAFQLKVVALVAMTLDHFAAYVMDIPGFRIIGRIAAVLFLYILVESLHHTRSKKAFLLRLYCANALVLLATLIFDGVLHWYRPTAPYIGTPSIFGTLFLTAFFIVLLEETWKACRTADGKAVAKYSAVLVAAIVLPILLLYHINDCPPLEYFLEHFHLENTIAAVRLYSGLVFLVPNVITMEYSVLFILLGMCWYFCRRKSLQILIFVLFCGMSYGGSHLSGSLWPMTEFFDTRQWWMILAAPLIALYSGKRGPAVKYFFYAYYPLHIFVLFWIGVIIR